VEALITASAKVMTQATDTRLVARNVSVTFSGNTVLKSADLDVKGGEIVGLLGANGSGKSTMVKVLTGVYRADRGAEVVVNGHHAPSDTYGPLRAHELGVRVVHQEAPVIPNVTIADMIGIQLQFPVVGPWIRQRRLEEMATGVLEACDVHVDPRRSASTMTAAERAMVSLATVLGDTRPQDAVLILDEASASLSTTDAEPFLARVQALAAEGLAVLMVTHRLAEVAQHCSRTIVLRDGQVVDRRAVGERDDRALVQAMAGPAASAPIPGPPSSELVDTGATNGNRATRTSKLSGPSTASAPLLRVDGLSVDGVHAVDLDIQPGEIVGVTGGDAGARQLLRLIAGIETRRHGRLVRSDGREVEPGSRGALDAGIVYLSSDRLSEGGVMNMSVAENLVLPKIERFGLLGRGQADAVNRMIEQLDVRPRDPSVAFGTLSGGNQQKVLLGRWLLLDPKLLILDDPTAGVDPGTRERLLALILDLSAEGVGVLIRSTEPDQLARLCRRVLVLRDGVLVRTLTGELVNPEEISLATYA